MVPSWVTIDRMTKHNQDGAVNGLVLSLILTVILLLASIGFGGWAFNSRQDYKNHSDAKAQVVAAAAVKKNSADKDKQFAEELKNPLTTFTGPQTLGSIVLMYPKTWSQYVDANDATGGNLSLYFNPVAVTSVSAESSTQYALRVKVVNQQYSNVLQGYASRQRSGKVQVSAYALPKLPNVVGSKIEGQITSQLSATVVLLPLRSQTIELETDGGQYLADFNNYILPNFSFSP